MKTSCYSWFFLGQPIPCNHYCLWWATKEISTLSTYHLMYKLSTVKYIEVLFDFLSNSSANQVKNTPLFTLHSPIYR